ncbi:MAG: sigma-70 family RNA polymerase sigma factor [Deltaproteobacteria bacterium]|nr:sigma-70 family RNA polymerase sigma factor [Deltaproteobacteria bacterium]
MPSDAELFAAWCEGNDKAGNALLRGHFPRLYCFFHNKAGDHTEDLIQQTMLACVQARGRLEDHSSFRAFLLRIARNKLYDFLRANSRNRVDFGVSSVHDLRPSPSSLVARDQEHVRVLESLQALPVDLQVVIEQHYWDELTVREVAEVLEIPTGTVKSLLRRARQALGSELRRRTGPHAELVGAMRRCRPGPTS